MRPFPANARFALILLALAAGKTPVLAQPALPPEDSALPDPAAAPPNPAELSPLAPAASAAPASPAMPGVETSPDGRWRIRFAGDAPSLAAPSAKALAALGTRLAALPQGRITIEAQASGPAADVSIARRLSLARGLAVKQALADGGLPPTRIDIRALGRTAEAVDAADVLPPRLRVQ